MIKTSNPHTNKLNYNMGAYILSNSCDEFFFTHFYKKIFHNQLFDCILPHKTSNIIYDLYKSKLIISEKLNNFYWYTIPVYYIVR
jgi:hypothetical protein